MSTSQHLALRAAIVQTLLTAPALAGGRIKPGRQRVPMVAGVPEEVRVWLHEADATRADTAGRRTHWQTQIAVHCMARTADGVDSAARVDALAQDVVARIASNPTLGGLALGSELRRVTWEGEALDTDVDDTVLVFSVTHRTPATTL